MEAVRFQKSDFLRCELEFAGFRLIENQLLRLYDSNSTWLYGPEPERSLGKGLARATSDFVQHTAHGNFLVITGNS